MVKVRSIPEIYVDRVLQKKSFLIIQLFISVALSVIAYVENGTQYRIVVKPSNPSYYEFSEDNYSDGVSVEYSKKWCEEWFKDKGKSITSFSCVIDANTVHASIRGLNFEEVVSIGESFLEEYISKANKINKENKKRSLEILGELEHRLTSDKEIVKYVKAQYMIAQKKELIPSKVVIGPKDILRVYKLGLKMGLSVFILSMVLSSLVIVFKSSGRVND